MTKVVTKQANFDGRNNKPVAYVLFEEGRIPGAKRTKDGYGMKADTILAIVEAFENDPDALLNGCHEAIELAENPQTATVAVDANATRYFLAKPDERGIPQMVGADAYTEEEAKGLASPGWMACIEGNDKWQSVEELGLVGAKPTPPPLPPAIPSIPQTPTAQAPSAQDAAPEQETAEATEAEEVYDPDAPVFTPDVESEEVTQNLRSRLLSQG